MIIMVVTQEPAFPQLPETLLAYPSTDYAVIESPSAAFYTSCHHSAISYSSNLPAMLLDNNFTAHTQNQSCMLLRLHSTLIACVLMIMAGAQNVGINTDGSAPHPSAALDIKSSNRGLLIPRVALTSATDVATIVSPQASLLVYNTATAGSNASAVSPGFYFWNGATWSRLAQENANTGNGWSLTGNAETDASHFIGTTDNKPLHFRVNNQPSGKIDITNVNTFFGYHAGKSITTGYGSIGIGQGALANATSAYDNIGIGEGTLGVNVTARGNVAIGKFALSQDTTGEYNVALGHLALRFNGSGSFNTALGRAAMYYNTTGSNNTAVGFQTLLNNRTGLTNTAIGREALYNNDSGHNNTAIGYRALLGNLSGSQNVALGFGADVQGFKLTNATAIGTQASVACSNCMVLGSVAGVNGGTSNVNVGIGTPSPTHPLSFGNVLGGKISFWNGGNGHYGIGIQSTLMQFFTDIKGSDFAFGWGVSDAFNETMRIKNSGNVGIGTSTPAHVLDISTGSDLNRTQLRLHQTNGDYARMRFTNTSSNNFWDMAVKPDVTNANAGFNFYYSPLNNNVLRLLGNGNAILLGTLTQNSDERLKRDIQPIQGAVDALKQLGGYHYHWADNTRDNTAQLGVLAQEVQQVAPELVQTDEKGILSVNYSGLIPILIEAVKEQQKEIEALKAKLGK